ncbi:hypothetical protein P154DRAFT_614791 [Amniculicola lignicola CBS 123094]|uniref:DUF7730 domain-containing protein n=1 Tax=Amniculicola lignicola CBS 123094 TaxID=1392246 RepID=A0A6A5X3F3_9PLEO|nr:hypothetical protein P154DRAFT_614791 [Amniculicola lignicola CBS 123094]
MTKFSAWVKKHLRSKPGRKKQPTDSLPFLASSRRSLTLMRFDAQTCLFFQLIDDVRSIILLMALGERTLHVDIARQEEAWKWRGAACPRNEYTLPCTRFGWCGPWMDDCLREVYEREEKSPRDRKVPERYKIGALGFLLSCRQAYAEGIDVLWSANCIFIQSEPLLLHLPRLIPPNRLASITSLEVVITAHGVEPENGGPTFNLDHLKPVLDNIATHCNHLRSLCLSLIDPNWNKNILDGVALPLVDTFYRSMPLRNLRVELPGRSYKSAHNYLAMEYHPRETPVKSLYGEKSLWRCLDGDEPRVQDRVIERFPYPPLKLAGPQDENDSVESAGYWLVESDESTGPLYYCECGVPPALLGQ